MATLELLPLRLRLRSQGLIFPQFPGPVWRSGLGKALAAVDPAAFSTLFQGEGDLPPYALLPDGRSRLPAGSTCELRITLFGRAVAHAPAVVQAMALLSRSGIDPAGRFVIEAVELLRPGGVLHYSGQTAGDTFAAWLAPTAPAMRVLAVDFITPLRIKGDNRLRLNAPSFAELMQRLLGRLERLTRAYGQDGGALPRAELLPVADAVHLLDANTQWLRLSRRSARSAEQMHFGGLVGRAWYHGPFGPCLPWLAAGRLLQLGGKTAFGFGGYDLTLCH
ncbi:MAG: CRISPR system precrRNA processing endoribonuclease RAMP protein Cas6 [Thiobacillaceae bacterium]|nr:CRISPR system precrRNA processing endoribonuclease RAMP protein Cas6 [Thiobacillaceae bacterium]